MSNKTNEQISILSKKYRRLKAVAFKRYEDMRAEINTDLATIRDYHFRALALAAADGSV